MAAGYHAVGWTPFKKRFDRWMLAGMAVFLAVFIGASYALPPSGQAYTPVQLVIRATGVLAFLMLTFALCIGPLARINRHFLPFLFNRRHLGVATFLTALVHAGLVLLWYHGFSDVNPIVSLLISNPRYDSISGFPFEALGLAALIILFVMAATSHDFWNTNLGPGLWKAIHMSVYGAYFLLVAHVALGAIQSEKHPAYFYLLCSGAGIVTIFHLATGFLPLLKKLKKSAPGDWMMAGPAMAIPDKRAIILTPPAGERIAVFRSGNRIFAVSNVCRHQGGPLGEGRIVDGCITCPWHGFQYRPEDGQSPPPYTEKIATYRVRVIDGMVEVDPAPNPPGTPCPPWILPEVTDV